MEKKVIEDLKSGNFEITVHAAIRMNEREVTKEDIKEDIKEVGRSSESVTLQESPNAPFKIRGKDLEGEVMDVICDYEEGTLIVTVLTKEEIE